MKGEKMKDATGAAHTNQAGLNGLLEHKVQSVILTFDDGTKAVFSGRAICKKGETRTIVNIKFTEPKDLPEDCSWESL